MKKITIVISIFTSLTFFSQSNFSSDFEPIRSELQSWDEIRGTWLSNSLEAMVYNLAIPSRDFPEDFTPAEMLRMVPRVSRENMQRNIEANYRNSKENSQRLAWREIKNIFQKSFCKVQSARSYGDPHLSSFDGANFSFQTVGEFVLAKSNSEKFEIQSRQSPQGNDFSLNTAIAMNVGGDRLCIYANETPDQISRTPVRLNGESILMEDRTYFLPKGGTIRKSKKNYLVSWPSGETASFDLTTQRKMNFMNAEIQIFPCSDEEYRGVLGNANQNRNDDFNVGQRSPQANFMAMTVFDDDPNNFQFTDVSNDDEKNRLAYIAKDFAMQYRLTDENTLFDYGFSENTMTYTDYFFPRVHRTMNDLSHDQRTSAQRTCENQGFRGAELRACIYDQGFLNIEPIKRPVIVDKTDGVVLTKIERKPTPVTVVPIVKTGSSRNEIEENEISPASKTKTSSNVAKPSTSSESKQMKVLDKVSKTPNNGSFGQNSKTEKVSSTPVKVSSPVIKTPEKVVSTPAKIVSPPAKQLPTVSTPQIKVAPNTKKGGGK